ILALPSALNAQSFQRFCLGIAQAFFGLAVPAALFFLSALATPDSKSECYLGWFDCFFEGKLWLAPLFLWALAAYYGRVIWQAPKPAPAWIVLGYVAGAIVCALSLLHSLISIHTILGS